MRGDILKLVKDAGEDFIQGSKRVGNMISFVKEARADSTVEPQNLSGTWKQINGAESYNPREMKSRMIVDKFSAVPNGGGGFHNDYETLYPEDYGETDGFTAGSTIFDGYQRVSYNPNGPGLMRSTLSSGYNNPSGAFNIIGLEQATADGKSNTLYSTMTPSGAGSGRFIGAIMYDPQHWQVGTNSIKYKGFAGN